MHERQGDLQYRPHCGFINGGYWIGDSIVDAALKQAGEI